MAHDVIRGVASGALGTVALNITTYLDMAIRGRATSPVPGQDVETLARLAGVDLSGGGSEQTADNRKEGIGALLGYLTGCSIGAVYGLVRPQAPHVPVPVAALAVGLGAMAATDGVTTLMGNSDPRDWSAGEWAMDIVPHIAYGAATAAAFEAFGD